MRPTRREFVALLAGLLLLLAPAAPLRADGDGLGDPPAGKKDADGGKKADKKDDEEKEEEKEEAAKKEKERKARIKKVLEAVRDEFKAKDASKLVKRIERKKKLQITLGGESGSYRAAQAKKILESWFEERTIVSLKLDRVTGTVGSLTLVTKKKGDDRSTKSKLQIELREEDETFHLQEIKES